MSRHDTTWAPSAGDVIEGRYRVRRMLDEGGVGVIFAAEHMRMRREVAIKFLHPDVGRDPRYRDRFEREVAVATSLDHANVVHCYDFGETGEGSLYLVMELLEGRSLKQLIRDEGRLTTRRATDLMLQLLDGMAAAHMAGVIHRDLKPGNVFVTTDHRDRERVKILDFGMAKSLTNDEIRLTATGSVLGTASYLPPEALVVQQTEQAGDVYALGLILLEMLIGRKVFGSRFMAQTFLQQLVVPARIPRRVWDTPLGEFLARCLAKHPEARPANADEAYQALDRVADRVEDFVLTDDEIPPRPSADLDDALLVGLSEGKYQDLATLKTLPAPTPWEPEAQRPDDAKTLRIVFDELDPPLAEPTDELTYPTDSATEPTAEMEQPPIDKSSAERNVADNLSMEVADANPDDTLPDSPPPTQRKLPKIEEGTRGMLPTIRREGVQLPEDSDQSGDALDHLTTTERPALTPSDRPRPDRTPRLPQQAERPPRVTPKSESPEEDSTRSNVVLALGGVVIVTAVVTAVVAILVLNEPADEVPSDPTPPEQGSESASPEAAPDKEQPAPTTEGVGDQPKPEVAEGTAAAPPAEPAPSKNPGDGTPGEETGTSAKPDVETEPSSKPEEASGRNPDEDTDTGGDKAGLDDVLGELQSTDSESPTNSDESEPDDDERRKQADEILERHLRLPDE